MGVTFVAGAVRVRAPATSANLGPGFDALGLALGLYDDVTARVTDRGWHVDVTGEGAGELPTDADHLVVRAMRGDLRAARRPPARAWPSSASTASRRPAGSARRRPRSWRASSWPARLVARRHREPRRRGRAAAGRRARGPSRQRGALPARRLHDRLDRGGRGGPGRAADARPPASHPTRLRARRTRADRDGPGGAAGDRAARRRGLQRRPGGAAGARADRRARAAASRRPRTGCTRTTGHPGMPATAALVDALRAVGVAAVVSGAGPTVLALTERRPIDLGFGNRLAQLESSWRGRTPVPGLDRRYGWTRRAGPCCRRSEELITL